MPRRKKAAPEAAPESSPAPVRGPRGVDEVVLVTGFEPFGGEKTNPSWALCRELPTAIGHARIEVLQVPCEFRLAIETVAEAIERLRPRVVISLGQAGGRDRLNMERVAINLDDTESPDNAGVAPSDSPIAPSGPAAYFATVPVKAMAAASRAAGVPAEVSNTAGTYVCNHLLYGILHYLAASHNPARAGFIHVPYSEAQVVDKPGKPSMSLAAMTRGVEAAIAAALEPDR